jgi:hypothetical protein
MRQEFVAGLYASATFVEWMNVPSDPGFVPATIISVPVQTAVRPAAIGCGASAMYVHGLVRLGLGIGAGRLEAVPEPPTNPSPTAIADAAIARAKRARSEFFALEKVDIVPPVLGVFSTPRVCVSVEHLSMDGTWALDGIVRFVGFELVA